jgi:hypothetical protein
MHLSDLIDDIRSKRRYMSLPEAMTALRENRIQAPPVSDSSLAGLTADERLPLKPEPQPPNWHYLHDKLAEDQRRTDAANRDEMRLHLRAKKLATTDAKAIQRYDELERQLGEMK